MVRERDTLYWNPDPIRESLENLESFTIDSSKIVSDEDRMRAENRMSGAAYPLDGRRGFLSDHVTDYPKEMEEFLREGGSLPRGMTLSVSTQFFIRGSTKRWNFLKDLTQEGRDAIFEGLKAELDRQVFSGYITKSEYETAVEGVARWRESNSLYHLLQVSEQPYNIDVQSMARRLEVANPEEPEIVSVAFDGRYLDLSIKEAEEEAGHLASEVLRLREGDLTENDVFEVLKDYWDGYFYKSDFSHIPKIVVWNLDRIISYGGYRRG
jgi:hypothetical protein